jgi:hypothetical protein
VGKDSFKHFENEDYYNIFLSTLNISIPASYLWLFFFFGLFHAFTNFWAEVTRFSDRRFYSVWWNAGSLAEYWPKWNSPIHNWLVRHLYYPMNGDDGDGRAVAGEVGDAGDGAVLVAGPAFAHFRDVEGTVGAGG